MGIRDNIAKALNLPAGSTTQNESQIVSSSPQSGTTATPLPRDPQDAIAPFPATSPLIPALINEPRSDGRADPRKWQFPVGWNIQIGGEQRAVPFQMLRDVADAADIVRKCVEVVKAAVASMEWDITLTDSAVRRVMEEQELGQTVAAKIAREALQPEMTRAQDFWQSPDRMNGMSFQEWVSMLLEEVLVIDALTIYPNRTLDNKALHSLEILDGTTIKPLLNARGSRPLPPHPAFQQVLWGFPRGEFTASADADGEFSQDDLVYAPRNRRANTPYGLSPVERCLPLVDLYMKRLQWLRTEFTDGVAPDVLMMTDATYGNNPQLLAGYEQVFNDALSGNMEQRRRMRILPQGMNPVFPPGADSKYSSQFDEWLIKNICTHFGVLPTQLGLTASGILGETGHQQGEANTAETIGLRPIIMWLEDLLNQLSYRFLGMPKDLKFKFSDGTEADEMAQATRRQLEFFSGLKPLNELRSEMGLPLFSFPEADQPLVVAGSTLTPVASAFETVAMNPEEVDSDTRGDQQEERDAKNPPEPIDDEESSATEVEETEVEETEMDVEIEAKSAELTQFIRWSRGDRKRVFNFKSVDSEVGEQLNHLVKHDADAARDLAAHLRKSGGIPKAPRGREPFPQNHPARIASDKLVDIYTAKFASVGSVDADRIAHQFLDNPSAAPRDWLKKHDVHVYGQPAVKLLEDLFYESAWMGTVSARVLIRDLKKKKDKSPVALSSPDWENWKPGNAEAAKELVSDGMGSGMRSMLDRAGLEIKGIDETTLDRIGNILSRGVEAGSPPDKVAREIRDLVGDNRRAEMIAHTEMARATNASNVDEYRNSGVTMVEWQTSGDDGVCEDCMEAEAGNPYEIGSEPEAPAHPNCGCQIIPAEFEDIVQLTDEERAEAEAMFSDEQPAIEEHPDSGAEPEMVSEADVDLDLDRSGRDGWVEGQWVQGDVEAHKQELREQWLSDPRNQPPHLFGTDPRMDAYRTAEYQKKVDKFEKSLTNVKSIHHNGENTMIDQYGLKPAEVQQAMRDFDLARRAAEAAGDGGTTVKLMKDAEFNASMKGASKADGYCKVIQPQDFGADITRPDVVMRGGLYKGGETIFERYTRVNGGELSERRVQNIQSHYSNDIRTTGYGTHVLTHEYGHATDSYRVDTTHQAKVDQLWKETSGQRVSSYANENAREGYAETWAKWVVTRGETIDETVLKYAETFKWRKP